MSNIGEPGFKDNEVVDRYAPQPILEQLLDQVTTLENMPYRGRRMKRSGQFGSTSIGVEKYRVRARAPVAASRCSVYLYLPRSSGGNSTTKTQPPPSHPHVVGSL